MSTLATKSRYTPDDLLSSEFKSFELVDGKLVEKDIGQAASWVAGKIYRAIGTHVESHRLGWTFPSDTSYQCFPFDAELVRRPDVSFIRSGRLPGETPYRGHCRIAPDLVVEVVSPNDLFSEVEEKVDEYLLAGVRVVWIVHPERRRGWVCRQGSRTQINENDSFDGEDVLPGFRCRLGDVLPPVATTQNGPQPKA